ncbi:MAG: twin-arginine translocase TatA/TatE family subunit [Chloroflexi bacterium]|nr:twin-arginine translocase TatA/TatE family subunit [Chloroflexota bacterium]
MRLGPWEIGLILVIVLIVFGVGRLPQVGNALGKSIREFRKAQRGENEAEAPTKTAEPARSVLADPAKGTAENHSKV